MRYHLEIFRVYFCALSRSGCNSSRLGLKSYFGLNEPNSSWSSAWDWYFAGFAAPDLITEQPAQASRAWTQVGHFGFKLSLSWPLFGLGSHPPLTLFVLFTLIFRVKNNWAEKSMPLGIAILTLVIFLSLLEKDYSFPSFSVVTSL